MTLKFKSALVLGSDGFLGRNMVRVLTEQGIDVIDIGRAEGDFTKWTTVETIFKNSPKVDKVFHLITQQRTGQIQYDIQGELLQNNARIHLNVLEAWRLHQLQAKLISTGSSCAFPEIDRAIVETDFQTGKLHESVRGYGIAKQLLAVGSETYAQQYGGSYLHLFLATVYGPFDHTAPDRSHFMTGMINRAVKEKAEGKKDFSVWGSPNTVRDLLYVDDQLDAILCADDVFENMQLNCSSNAPVSIGHCAEAICDALNWEAKIVYPSETFRGADYKTLDASTFLKKTNWEPKTSISQGLQVILNTEYEQAAKR